LKEFYREKEKTGISLPVFKDAKRIALAAFLDSASTIHLDQEGRHRMMGHQTSEWGAGRPAIAELSCSCPQAQVEH